jgi:hypothetical protein
MSHAHFQMFPQDNSLQQHRLEVSACETRSCFACRYVFSADVARALHEVNAIAPLKFMPNEDATFGFWVMGMDLRHVDQPM